LSRPQIALYCKRLAGHEVGAENWALLASLIANCKMCDVDPVSYLSNTLRALLDGHPKSRIDALIALEPPDHVKQRRVGDRRGAYR